jgi:hypothetical protein
MITYSVTHIDARMEGVQLHHNIVYAFLIVSKPNFDWNLHGVQNHYTKLISICSGEQIRG